jgi:integrase
MASISTDPRGNRTVQFIASDGKRRSIRLGRIAAKHANEIRLKIESINAAKVSALPLDNETARWVGSVGDDLADKLAGVGLITERGSTKLDGFIASYITRRTDVKDRTRINLEAGRRHLVEFFGTDRPLREITPADADQWVIHMRGKYAAATAARAIKRARQYFTAARRAKLISENPFENIKPGQMENRDRMHYVTEEVTARILDACPNAEWRALVALCRYGGLRCPSEPLQLRWTDIDWDRGRFLVRSPKLEHTASKGRRWVPLFPELRDHLEELFNQAPEGSTWVITLTRNIAVNLRTQFERIIHRAGLLPWPRLFQNLRTSRETELAARFPLHVVTTWIGNSAAIAAKHYLQVTEADFEAASQRAAKSGAVRGALDGQAMTCKDEQRLKMPTDQTLSTAVHSGQLLNIPPRGFEPLS